MTKITTPRPGLIRPPRQPAPAPLPVLNVHAAASPIASIRYGIASSTSTTREMTVSVQPRKYPARRPVTTPTRVERAVAAKATISETRAP
jgi:hypothetical protein